jgi:D-sedoheptulose 7-phosphate isomerase
MDKTLSFAHQYFKGLTELAGKLDYEAMSKIIDMIWDAYKRQVNIYFMGNGGSASIASHLAADIGKNAMTDWNDNNEDRFRTLALTDNVAWMTALANDVGYENVFVEQLRNLARKGDMIVVISSSGNSPNVVKAAAWAKEHGITVAALVGFEGGKLKEIADVSVWVPAKNYGYVEGLHGDIHHYLVEALKKLKEGEKH